jgi:hypothetical protein
MADTTRAQLASGTGSAAAVAPTPLLRLIGISVAESAGSPAAAAVSIQEGAGTDLTKELCALSLAASEAKTVWLGEHGVPCPGGIWVNRITGSTRVVIHYRVADRDKDSFSPPSW